MMWRTPLASCLRFWCIGVFLHKIKTEVALTFKNHNEYRREGQRLPLIPMVETFFHHLGKFNATLKANFKQA